MTKTTKTKTKTTKTSKTKTSKTTTHSPFVRPLHRLRPRPDEPGRALRAAGAAAHGRRAV
ncbi:hypothetical protein ACFYZ3_33450 [Streptomyces sp. NPDC001599]|uniref:hypothetical protein n=1 Tax=Streptomyces sp. NPDC001599 TaxID=3364591 RepID=UPI00369A946F